jgi:ribosomal protein S18 acetylase RimI-like enzyme
MPLHLQPFTDDHLPAAAELLAQRHARDRQAEPALPARFEDPTVARRAVEMTWRRPHTSGAVALDDGRLVGYLLGQARADTLRERHVWMALPGHAVAASHGPELYGDLYAAAGPRWMALGCFTHFILVPPYEQQLLTAWFKLSFGLEQVHGLCDLQRLDLPEVPVADDITIRRAHLGDRLHVAAMHDVIASHQAGAPVWGATLPETLPEMRQGYGDLVDEADTTTWIALDGKRPLGLASFYPDAPSDDDLLSPERTTSLHVAGTVPDARGRGVARALSRQGLLAAREAGYAYCLADWRSTNLQAARFWPRQGFRPVAYRLIRRVDGRVLWATGRAERE